MRGLRLYNNNPGRLLSTQFRKELRPLVPVKMAAEDLSRVDSVLEEKPQAAAETTFEIPKQCKAGVCVNEGPDFRVEVQMVDVPEPGECHQALREWKKS